MPRISVILAAYNSEKYLVSAVESILHQTYRDFELLLFDDGSTDSTPRIIREFGKKDHRVIPISRPNKGLTRTLNEGIERATGEYLARMDADDISLPERFEKQVAYLDAHPECVCLGTRVTLIDPYGSPIRVGDHKLTHEQIESDLLRGIGWAIVHPAAMMRTEAVRRLGGYREQFKTSQDLDLFLRLGEIGKLANLPEPLVQYRQHFESVNNTKSDEQWRVKSIIVAEAYDRRGLPRPDEWNFQKRVPKPVEAQISDWFWAAIKTGNRSVAFQHARDLFRLKPFSTNTWKILYCALRGR